MLERKFLNSSRIVSRLKMIAPVLVFVLAICRAGYSGSPLSHSDTAESDGQEYADSSTTVSRTSALRSELSYEPMIRPIEGGKSRGVDWGGVLNQSAFFLLVEQGFRLGTQPDTREALEGEFFDDWFKSVKSTSGWGDGDDFLTNYIGHPMQGAVVAHIFVQNDPGGRDLAFSWSSRYWNSRLKAMGWNAIYSTQFELGPISEASIGNVGYQGKSKSGAVDLVVTPLAGLGWQVGEDALDKYVIVKIEAMTTNPVILMLARSFLNPTRSFANVMRWTVPWTRDTRPGIWTGRTGNR